jgi:hypothetical protein
MERRKEDPDSIELSPDNSNLLWKTLIEIYAEDKNIKLSTLELDNPKIFWRKYGTAFYEDFKIKTNYTNSQILLYATDNGKENLKGKGDIKKKYIKDHFVVVIQSNFKINYLNRIIYYIVKKRGSDQYIEFFKKKGIDIYSPENQKPELPQGVKNLAGWWIGLNKNLEEGLVAKCHYFFEEKDGKMWVKREAYNIETLYSGYVHVQDDSQYIFDLVGKIHQRKKYIMAHTGKVKPVCIRCISSGFEVTNSSPVLIKEILFKIPDKTGYVLGQGQTIPEEKLKEDLSQYFQNEYLHEVLDEINDFLPNQLLPYISLNDFLLLKKDHFHLLKEAAENPNTLKKLSVYYHFNQLKGNDYKRDIIKYYKIKKQSEEIPKILNSVVKDEYTKIKISEYLKEDFYAHRVFYETDNIDTAVDIQSLFPIIDSDTDNDLKQPMPRISHRILDAKGTTFVSSATIINDFLPSKRIAVHFEQATLKTEIVIDFSSVQHQINGEIFIDDLSIHYNEPDGKRAREIHFSPEINNNRGFVLKDIDRIINEMKVDQVRSIDKDNPRIFSLLLDFNTFPSDILYIHFKFNVCD